MADNKKGKLQILDTTLRDGEQTSGVSFTETEKMTIAAFLLEEVKVDRIEIASARVSEGEFLTSQAITKYAKEKGMLDRVEFLGFVDHGKSLDWIEKAGGQVVNLLCKGSLKHVKQQLRKEPAQHLDDIKANITMAKKQGFKVNIYLEDWSNGMKNSPEYVYFLLDVLQHEPIERYMLPDTLGVLNQDNTFDYCKDMKNRYPGCDFDFHAHNDYDLAAANTYASVKAGMTGVHTTVNGLGERAGNVPLSSVIAILKDQLHCELSVDESKLYRISELVQNFSGVRIPTNKPVIGENVFTQTCGVHADGDSKDNLYYNDLIPERFGRIRQYALGKTSGKANIEKNLQELGINLDTESKKKLTQRIIELGDKKETITKEDLPYIISDVLHSRKLDEKIKIVNYSLSTVNGLKPFAIVKMEICGNEFEESAVGDGQYDAFMKAIWKIYDSLGKQCPSLEDYIVHIPPGGKTDALVETMIIWGLNGKTFKTRGLDSDQTVAAIKATVKMLNTLENMG